MIEPIRFRINGKAAEMKVEGERRLLWVLRTDLALTGTKYGCGIGLCGSCTVVVEGEAVRSCSTTHSGLLPCGPWLSSLAASSIRGSITSEITSSPSTLMTSRTAAGENVSLTLTAASSGIQDAAGNDMKANAAATVTYDATAPTAAITPSGSTASSSPITFTVTFDEPVIGVKLANFSATGSTTASLTISDLQAISSTVYQVNVSGMAAAGESVTLTLTAAGSGIADMSGNALAANAAATVAYDTTAPTATPSAAVNGNKLVWTIQFAEGVTGFDISDLMASGSVTQTLTLQNFTVQSASLYTVEVVGMTTVSPGLGLPQNLYDAIPPSRSAVFQRSD